VAVYSRFEPTDVVVGFGSHEFDPEGRYVELRFDTPARRISVISAYFPSGSSGEERQLAKFRFLDQFYPHLVSLKLRRDFILCGDVNIAHKEIDLKNWKSNQKNSGFLPEERAWMTKLLDQAGMVDVYRQLHPAATDDGLHLVEQPGAGLCEERGVAAGLPPGDTRAGRRREDGGDLQGPEVLRPRADHGRVRLGPLKQPAGLCWRTAIERPKVASRHRARTVH
jgi:hypothetical protein